MDGFEPLPDGGAALILGPAETVVLRALAQQLTELLDSRGAPEEPADPLAAVLAPGPEAPPGDPVLARLFPDAYDDPDAADTARYAAEFRRFTENDLRARKRADAAAVIAALDDLEPDGDGAVLKLDEAACRRWLGALNDLRLALAARLEIATEADADALYDLDEDDPRTPTVIVYSWLNLLQDSLIEAFAG